MSKPVISVENLSKSYTLGQIGTGTFSYDMAVWLARMRGKPNPMLRIGETDHGNRVGEEIWALKDVSFQVQQGEVLGVIGRNGAGKSTLLKILSRVTAPTSGEVKVKGRIASLLEVGTGFHPELTGRENIYLNGAILGMSKAEVTRKFDEIVDFSGVEKFIDTPVKRYSSGMYVRLAFAVAAHLESEILLVDEVLAVGDAEFQKKCLGKMGDIAEKEGRSVLFVSHNLRAIEELCPKTMIISSGSIHFIGDSSEAFYQYREKIVAKFVQKNMTFENNELGLRIKNSTITTNIGETYSMIMGTPFTISTYLENTQTISNIIIGYLITDTFDSTIIRAYSRESSPELLSNVYQSKISCTFLENRLMPGTYFLRIWIGSNRNSMIIDVPKALKFEIIPADVYNSGVIPDSNNGGVFFQKHVWKID